MIGFVNINVSPDRVYKISAPAGVDVYYSDVKVGGSGTQNVFVAIEGVSRLRVESAGVLEGTITLTEILRSYYETYDGTGGTWLYQPAENGWMTRASFLPEAMSMVGNRLIAFKNGMPWVHDGQTNSFFGQVFDSVVAIAHSEDSNTIKSYRAVTVEGDKPDRLHVRTEVPDVQSSDLIASDYSTKEGVHYSQLYRDRLSPNATGTYDQRLYTGDPIRGEIAKMMIVFREPSSKKEIKFFNIDFDNSLGQTV